MKKAAKTTYRNEISLDIIIYVVMQTNKLVFFIWGYRTQLRANLTCICEVNLKGLFFSRSFEKYRRRQLAYSGCNFIKWFKKNTSISSVTAEAVANPQLQQWDLLFHFLGSRLKGNHFKISVKKTKNHRLIKRFTLFTHFHKIFTYTLAL